MSVSWIGLSPSFLNTCEYHSHTDWEIVLNISGEGKALIEGKYFDFSRGTIICIPPYWRHTKSSGGGFQDIFMHVDSFLIPNVNEPLVFSDDEENSIETLLLMILRVYHKKESNFLAIISSLEISIQQILFSWHNNKKKNESVELLKNEIIKNFSNAEFRISDAEKSTPYSTDHVRRRFKADTGMNPMEYLMNLRIEYAASLLRQKKATGRSISEIAYLSGFYDPHYFSRLFKKQIGVSPKQYSLLSEKTSDKQSFAIEKETLI